MSIDKWKKCYLVRLILEIEKFKILEKGQIGLVVVNELGKTTLIKALNRQNRNILFSTVKYTK